MKDVIKTILLFLLFGMSGCTALWKTPANPDDLPATRSELKDETQRLQDAVESQYKQCSQQQADMTAQLKAEFEDMRTNLKMLYRKINTLNDTPPAPIEISDEQCPPPPRGQTADGKLLLGEAEWLWIDAAGQAFRARIDTGAETSSINAVDITIFERDSEKWVRFFMSHKGTEDHIQIEAPLIRHVRVRQASTDDLDRRPVVLLSVRVGDQNEQTEFTLTDRSRMEYPVLLGRDFLKDIAVVDVGRKYIQPKLQSKDIR
jgi:hypothetical protein